MSSILDFLRVYSCDHKIRLGNLSDGGYVCADIGNYDCYISCGVSNEESFSRDFIEKYGMNAQNSFAFDGTIANYPYHYTNKITFYKKNIAPYQSPHHANLRFFIDKFDNIFLKMDIEGWEYPWLNSLSVKDLSKFKQIVIEFHGINDNSWNSSYSDKKLVFEKLNQTHYIVHLHGNNYSGTTNSIPDVIEVTYIRKTEFTSSPSLNNKPLPDPLLDYPCRNSMPDYNLNFEPFVFTYDKQLN